MIKSIFRFTFVLKNDIMICIKKKDSIKTLGSVEDRITTTQQYFSYDH